MEWRDLLVRLRVPFLEHGQAEWRVGTAFPVGERLLLTSKHVIKDWDKISGRRLQARRHGQRDEGFIDLPDDLIAWEHPSLDAVVLKGPPEPHPPYPTYWPLSPHKPRDGDEWSSAGYARVGKTADDRELQGVQGKTLSMGDTDDHFEIDVPVHPAKEDNWHGASGMPVILHGKLEILGIARLFPPGWGGGRLHAVPSWKLLQDPAFRALLKVEQREKKAFGDCERDVARFLEGSKAALDAIINQTV